MEKLDTKEKLAEGLKKWLSYGNKVCSTNSLKMQYKYIISSYESIEDEADWEKVSVLNNGCYDLYLVENTLIIERVAGLGSDGEHFVSIFVRF